MINRITLIQGDIAAQGDVDSVVATLPVTLKIQSAVTARLLAAAPKLDDLILEHVFEAKAGDVFAVPCPALPCRTVLFAITPPWKDGTFDRQDRDLIVCYRHAVEAARRLGMRRIAFPALGTGKRHGFPPERAVRLAVNAVLERIGNPVEEVRFVVDRVEIYDAFMRRLSKHLP